MNAPVLVAHIRQCPIDELEAYVNNAWSHSDAQIDQIAASIREFGFVNPILIGPDQTVIAGHARLLAARRLGLREVPVIVLDHLSDAQRRALVIADNQLALNASWDEELLRTELAALQEQDFELDLLGFGEEELAALLVAEEPLAGLTDEDAVPDTPKVAVTVPGDLWILGLHRLLCGDANVADHVAQLMANQAADLVFTDPPYNVDYEGYTEDHLKIQGDRLTAEQFQLFLMDTFRAYGASIQPTASLYVCHASAWQREFQGALEAAGFLVRCQIIWAKNTFAWGFGRYKFQHEPIFYCHRKGHKDAWYGDQSQSTLWQQNKPAANRLHPTMKPVELIERALENSSRAGDIVLDLFGGSGSTLIACERHCRRARLMEIDPRYADVIVRRWQDYSGQAATLQNDGKTFAGVADLRRDATR